MNVIFISDQKGNTVIQCPEIGPKHVIRFTRGRCKTSNKTEIRRLLSDEYARRYTKLAPGQDLEKISEYLDSNDRPDTFTQKYLDRIPFKLWEKILAETNAIDVRFPLVGIAKASLVGKPIDPVIERIVDDHFAGKDEEVIDEEEIVDEEIDDEEEEEVEEPVKVDLKKVEPKKEKKPDDIIQSDAHSVRQMKDYLKGKEYDEVSNYLADGEERVSLLKFWNEKYPDNAVELP